MVAPIFVGVACLGVALHSKRFKMQAILIAVAGYIVSGLVWRLLASIGFSIITIGFINTVVNDYINRALDGFNTSMPLRF